MGTRGPAIAICSKTLDMVDILDILGFWVVFGGWKVDGGWIWPPVDLGWTWGLFLRSILCAAALLSPAGRAPEAPKLRLQRQTAKIRPSDWETRAAVLSDPRRFSLVRHPVARYTITMLKRDYRTPEAAEYRRLYKTARWSRIRAAQLRAKPLCEWCEARGLLVKATVAHHTKAHGGREALFFDAGNLTSLCKPCHDGPAQAIEAGRAVVGVDGWPMGGGVSILGRESKDRRLVPNYSDPQKAIGPLVRRPGARAEHRIA
jgi:5-methylcytosine-specific restriction enzyme A